MKNQLLILVAACGLSLAAHAQSTTNEAAAVQSSQTFFQSAENYFTTFNTNYTWSAVTLEASTGYKQVTGVNAASTLDVQYDFASSGWSAGVAAQFSGVGSPINALEAAVGYALVSHYDTKLQADLRAGYDWNVKGAVIEPVVLIKKKLTANTFAETGISLPIYSQGTFNRNPTFYLETGFTY